MDLSALPRVQDLLAAKGYTQVQKGDEIIKLEPSAQEPTEPKTLSPQEAKELLESKQGQRLPQELDIQSFLKSLESVENK